MVTLGKVTEQTKQPPVGILFDNPNVRSKTGA